MAETGLLCSEGIPFVDELADGLDETFGALTDFAVAEIERSHALPVVLQRGARRLSRQSPSQRRERGAIDDVTGPGDRGVPLEQLPVVPAIRNEHRLVRTEVEEVERDRGNICDQLVTASQQGKHRSEERRVGKGGRE